MRSLEHLPQSTAAANRPWDARLARRLVVPLNGGRVTPNHLTTLRLGVGLAAAAAFTPGTYGWSNLAALLLVLSNFLDHADGELARISGRISRFGHLYDVASDAAVTVLIFIAMGIGVAAAPQIDLELPPALRGAISGGAIALIFFMRTRMEEMLGKGATRQAYVAGFETEDVLYLLPVVTLCNGTAQFLLAATICAPLFAVWVAIDYRRELRIHRLRPAYFGFREVLQRAIRGRGE
jgi:archaetidylinositol phosphate synthase